MDDIGTLFDIIPVKRSTSGRLKEIEILGSRKNIKIKSERDIRNALSDKTLLSSCFVVHSDIDDDGIPLHFTFYGAGAGHGVGMCQAGATAMSLNGKDYKSILNHYFKDVNLEKIY